jgi:biotin-[acetyl-CoA-carboxylase] ligase BirA-like protein
MNHLHFETIESTQTFLKDKMNEFEKEHQHNLVSCDFQSKGIGRSGNAWIFDGKSLAMSFSIRPHATLSLTPIEMGLITLKFFKENFNQNILLKWPNDLMNEKKEKIGGLISHYHHQNLVIVGLGLNLNQISIDASNFKHGINSLKIEKDYHLKSLSKDLFHFILNNRIKTDEEIVELFYKNCIHQNILVENNEPDLNKTTMGLFMGINNSGAAILKENELEKEFISGSLLIKT